MTSAVVRNIELGHSVPQIDTVERLASVLLMSPSSLAYGIDQAAADGAADGKGLSSHHVGARLSETRTEAGISKNALGHAAQVSGQAIANIENGVSMPTVATVESLADALEVSPAWLAYGEGPQVIRRRRARPSS